MLSVDPNMGDPAAMDLFSQASIQEFLCHPFDQRGYRFTQVFEPYVLQEIARIEKVSRVDLEYFRIGDGEIVNQIRERLAAWDKLNTVQALNLVSILMNFSRFSLSLELLNGLKPRIDNTRDHFEHAMLLFIIHNRLGDKVKMREDLLEMKALIETNEVPSERALDAAVQAVVWYFKDKVLSDEEYGWFESLGTRICSPNSTVRETSQSSWYRAIAMAPAADNDAEKTQLYMDLAKAKAEDSIKDLNSPYEMHLLKTYYESTIKQHMYLTRDLELAEINAKALIKLDPNWSPSYGAFAQIEGHFGKPYIAAKLYLKAAEIGAPYIGHHYFNAAQSFEKAEDYASAMELYEMLFSAFPEEHSVVVAGYKLSSWLGGSMKGEFAKALESIDNSLSPKYRAYLETQ